VPELSSQAFEDFQGKYDVMVGANSRALRLARRAESHRILRNNPGVREAENNQQCNRWSVPEYREQDQSVNTNRQDIAHLDPEYRDITGNYWHCNICVKTLQKNGQHTT
jgi:hypothetical protein